MYHASYGFIKNLKSFKFKSKLTCNTNATVTKDVDIAVPLKYFSNSLENI